MLTEIDLKYIHEKMQSRVDYRNAYIECGNLGSALIVDVNRLCPAREFITSNIEASYRDNSELHEHIYNVDDIIEYQANNLMNIGEDDMTNIDNLVDNLSHADYIRFVS